MRQPGWEIAEIAANLSMSGLCGFQTSALHACASSRPKSPEDVQNREISGFYLIELTWPSSLAAEARSSRRHGKHRCERPRYGRRRGQQEEESVSGPPRYR